MTKEEEHPKCKLRFKGVENFMRRVAFNLGNTPSQTEVKIISCIPIDVTDLQQKIVQLERQLEDSRNVNNGASGVVENNGTATVIDVAQNPINGEQKPTNGSSKRASTVHTAIFRNTFPRCTGVRTEKFNCCESNKTEFSDGRSSEQRKSAVSFLLSASPSTKVIHMSSKSDFAKEDNYSSVAKENRRNFFKKPKRFPKKKINSHFVYYTSTVGTPFRDYGKTQTAKDVLYHDNDVLSKSYLSNMRRKQYESFQVLDDLSNMSQFTSPRCKDIEPSVNRIMESDICSCCHGSFQNIDDYVSKTKFDAYSAFKLTSNRNHAYYDSSLYDLIPVKENLNKGKKEYDKPNRDEPKIEIKCWPEDVRVKVKNQPLISKYESRIPNNSIYTKKKVQLKSYNNNTNVLHKNLTKYHKKVNQEKAIQFSRSCHNEYGDINTKPSPRLKSIKLFDKQHAIRKEVECLTTIVNHSECQTVALSPILNANENKTEATLNQIKCILQTVLTEVKTSSIAKRNEKEPTKDAIVQYGVSQNNMQNKSSLLNSYTYSPYTINPHGLSHSKQMPPNCFCYQSLQQPINCMQNYPLIIQGTGRNLCTSCYQSSQIKTLKETAITASTNTDRYCENRNKETEKLIQEIYKSVALDVPTNDTSLSECATLKSFKDKIYINSPLKQNTQVRKLFTNRNVENDTSRTNETNTTINSKITRQGSTQSQMTSTNTSTLSRAINENTKAFFANKTVQLTTETEPETEKEVPIHRTEPKQKTPSTGSESNESEDSSETDSVKTVLSAKEIQVKKNNGILCKIFRIFNKSKNTNNSGKGGLRFEEPDTSDSDDYQTIYSHKSETSKHDKSVNKKRKTHSKILYSRRGHHYEHSPEKHKRIPYMEQEYRKLWHENLMYQNGKQQGVFSEKPFTNEAAISTKHQHPYYKNYEARNVLIDPERFHHCKFNQQTGNPVYTNAPYKIFHRNQFGPQSNPVPHSGNGYIYNREGNIRPSAPGSTFNRKVIQNAPQTFHIKTQEQTKKPNSLLSKRPVNSKKPNDLSWFKKHNLAPRCGPQWKQLILES